MSRRRSDGRNPFVTIGLIVVVAALAAAGVFLYQQYTRPLPELEASVQLPAEGAVPGSASDLPWPDKGAAAVGVEGLGLLASHGGDTPRAMASTAKIMTALIILENHPLGFKQPGPTITITPEDVADYELGVQRDESVVPVVAGEQLTQYQLLQGLLLPSGNNIANVLAKWDAGSVENFVAKMNERAAELGMKNTHFDDASGFSAQTVSTPSDLVILSEVAMKQPVFAEIVAQPQATLPVAGVVYNVNSIIGQDGNIGIKTGSTEDAGACFVSAVTTQFEGKPINVYATTMGQDVLVDAFDVTKRLSQAVPAHLTTAKVLSKDDIVATFTPPWGGKIDVVPADDAEFLTWPGTSIKKEVQIEPVEAPLAASTKVGTVTVTVGSQSKSIDLLTTAPIPEPDRQWRLTRFLQER